MNINKCYNGFPSPFAYINNEPIHFNEINNENKDKLKCKNGHVLIYINGINNIKHFRHKYSHDIEKNNSFWDDVRIYQEANINLINN